jgi:lysophospholipase L1-like esterase
MVEGDSWYDYPGRNGHFFLKPSNLFEGLLGEIHSPCNWFDAAVSGYTTSQLLRNENKQKQFAKRGVTLSLHFISAGGNDIFDRLDLILKPYVQIADHGAKLNLDNYFTDELSHTLQSISAYYQSLKARRDKYSPNTPLVAHDYAPPIARTRAFTFLWLRFLSAGPWVNKVLNEKGYTHANLANPEKLRLEIINHIHSLLSKTIKDQMPESEYCYVYSARDRGLNLTVSDYWDDEIHLSPRGNRKVARDLLSFLKEKALYSRFTNRRYRKV